MVATKYDPRGIAQNHARFYRSIKNRLVNGRNSVGALSRSLSTRRPGREEPVGINASRRAPSKRAYAARRNAGRPIDRPGDNKSHCTCRGGSKSYKRETRMLLRLCVQLTRPFPPEAVHSLGCVKSP